MAKVDDLIKKFEKVIKEPWAKGLSGQEKVWFLVFDPTELRRVEFRLGDFEILTKNSGRSWHQVSLHKLFTSWMANNAYKEAYFEDPEYISDALQGDFKQYVLSELDEALTRRNEEDALIVLKDVSAIFGFLKLSEVINALSNKVKGRMMVLFPGEFSNNQYRLMDARDGWDYLARPITL
jgi:hypothetical protein